MRRRHLRPTLTLNGPVLHGVWLSSVVNVRLAGRVMSVVLLTLVVLLTSARRVLAAAANGIGGASMSLQRNARN